MKVTFTATVTQYTNFPFILKLLKHPFSKQSYYRFILPAFSFWATILTPFSEQAIASSFLQLFCYMTLSVCHPHLHGYHYILTTVIVWNPSTVRFSNNNRFAYYVGYSIKKWQVPQVKEGTVLLNLLEFLQREAMSRLSASLTSTETEEVWPYFIAIS